MPPPTPAASRGQGRKPSPPISRHPRRSHEGDRTAGPQVIFHLAGVVSGEAELDFEKGYRVNLDGTRALLEAIRATGDGYRPKLVYTSSIAVFGAPFPHVDPRRFSPHAAHLLRHAEGHRRVAACRLHPPRLLRRRRHPPPQHRGAAGQAEQGGVGLLLRHHPRAAGGSRSGAAGGRDRHAYPREPARRGRLPHARRRPCAPARSGRASISRCRACAARSPSRSRRCDGSPASGRQRASAASTIRWSRASSRLAAAHRGAPRARARLHGRELVRGNRAHPHRRGPRRQLRRRSGLPCAFPPALSRHAGRRYKRFLADVVLPSGESHRALRQSRRDDRAQRAGRARVAVEVRQSRSASSPIAGSWSRSISAPASSSSASTPAHPNALAAEAIAAGAIPELAGYAAMRREVRYGRNSRVDFLLAGPGAAALLRRDQERPPDARGAGLAEFPDAVTERGAKHLAELGDMVAAGDRAVMLFLIQIGSAERFALARDIDPAYGRRSTRAARRRRGHRLALRDHLRWHRGGGAGSDRGIVDPRHRLRSQRLSPARTPMGARTRGWCLRRLHACLHCQRLRQRRHIASRPNRREAARPR